MVEVDLQDVASLSSSDRMEILMMCKTLAHTAAQHASAEPLSVQVDQPMLRDIEACIKQVKTNLQTAWHRVSQDFVLPPIIQPPENVCAKDSTFFSLFDRYRRHDDIEKYAGDSDALPILRPVCNLPSYSHRNLN